MSEASEILAKAQQRASLREQQSRSNPIDYARMKAVFPKQKARLTRALHMTEAIARQEAVLLACRDAVHEWDAIGAWPDDWSRWQRALDDQFPVFTAPQLEDLR